MDASQIHSKRPDAHWWTLLAEMDLHLQFYREHESPKEFYDPDYVLAVWCNFARQSGAEHEGFTEFLLRLCDVMKLDFFELWTRHVLYRAGDLLAGDTFVPAPGFPRRSGSAGGGARC